jgi:hypothetical protein
MHLLSGECGADAVTACVALAQPRFAALSRFRIELCSLVTMTIP